ncbi:MAG TPA: hypothetical protein PLG60_09115 [Acidimicrobiales bacterium]|nr:hypothetical protein [Acidimicrobiales bacterium]
MRWRVVAGPDEWLDRSVEWVLREEDGFTIIMCRHLGWREPVALVHHCSTTWAVFLLSLKSLLETGTGAPDPHDTPLSNGP